MNMTIDFYYTSGSASCRAVLLTAKAIGVELNSKFIDLNLKDQLKPEFLKLNPQHIVPTVVDDGFSLWESHAIITYLVEKYGRDDSLYPKDPKKRALVNQRLYFDAGTLYQSFADAYYPFLFADGVPPTEDKLKILNEAFEFLDLFLSGSEFAAGDSLTLADISLATSVTSILTVDFDLSKYPNVAKWLEKTKKLLPGFEEVSANDNASFRQLYLNAIKK